MQLFCISIIDTVIIYFDLVFESLVSGQSSASMDTSVLPARHQESFSISAEQHIEVNKKVQMFNLHCDISVFNSQSPAGILLSYFVVIVVICIGV